MKVRDYGLGRHRMLLKVRKVLRQMEQKTSQ